MRKRFRYSSILAACCFLVSLSAAQEGSSKPQENLDGFYSGTLTSVAEDKIVVARAILGKPAETHTFILNTDTKVEGKLKAKSRVTVRWVPGETGDVAVSVLVRDGKNEKKK